MASFSAYSEDDVKFKVTPSGRLLIDGAVYASPQKYLFGDGVAIPEVRLGAKMSYGKWSSYIDFGFAYGKIGLRNLWIQYDFNSNNNLRVGNFLQPYGLQSQVSANTKTTFEQPLASLIFNPGLQLGIMFVHHNPNIYSATSLHAESNALTNVMNYPYFNQQGYSLLSRFVWHTKKSAIEGNPVIHGGISIGLSTPERHLVDDYDVHDGFTNTGIFPTKVSTETALSVTVSDSRFRFKLTPEFLFAYKRFALEYQFLYQTITRKNGLPSFNSYGTYINLRGILFGQNYTYDPSTALLVNPAKNTLECVIDYNYANLCDPKADLWGGRANSFNITLNYYFNKYFTARLNYSFTHTWDRDGVEPITQNVVQARLMVLF